MIERVLDFKWFVDRMMQLIVYATVLLIGGKVGAIEPNTPFGYMAAAVFLVWAVFNLFSVVDGDFKRYVVVTK